jgi:hypothetical protein
MDECVWILRTSVNEFRLCRSPGFGTTVFLLSGAEGLCEPCTIRLPRRRQRGRGSSGAHQGHPLVISNLVQARRDLPLVILDR